jgi:hypothetical protein
MITVTQCDTVEGFYSVFKRGMKGVYQHCSEKHLHRYLSEFDFRYNNRSPAQKTRNALPRSFAERLVSVLCIGGLTKPRPSKHREKPHQYLNTEVLTG